MEAIGRKCRHLHSRSVHTHTVLLLRTSQLGALGPAASPASSSSPTACLQPTLCSSPALQHSSLTTSPTSYRPICLSSLQQALLRGAAPVLSLRSGGHPVSCPPGLMVTSVLYLSAPPAICQQQDPTQLTMPPVHVTAQTSSSFEFLLTLPQLTWEAWESGLVSSYPHSPGGSHSVLSLHVPPVCQWLLFYFTSLAGLLH